MKGRLLRWNFALASALAMSAFGVPNAHADGSDVTITDLGVLPGSTCDCSAAVAINAFGQVAGYSGSHPALWTFGQPQQLSDGTVTALNDFGVPVGTVTVGQFPVAARWVGGQAEQLVADVAHPSFATGVNNAGAVTVNYVHDPAAYAPDTAAVWANGRLTDLRLPGPAQVRFATAINDVGVVVGYQSTRIDGDTYAWSCQRGACQLLPDLGTPNAGATAVNGLGQIAGNAYLPHSSYADEHAVRWVRGRIQDLGTLGGQTSAVAAGPHSINQFGDVVGQSQTADGQTHAFFWHDGTMTDLGTLGGPYSAAAAVNDLGEVTGVSSLSDGTQHAFVWREGVLTDLGTLPGGATSTAADINDLGQIAGSSQVNTTGARLPTEHAVVWQVR